MFFEKRNNLVKTVSREELRDEVVKRSLKLRGTTYTSITTESPAL